MTRINRAFNLDGFVNTKTMDPGIRDAKAKMAGLATEVDRLKQRSEKFSSTMNWIGAGAGLVGVVAPFRAVDALLSSMANNAQRAESALKAFRESGASIVEQGFSPTSAAALASQRSRLTRDASGGFFSAFQGEDVKAGGSILSGFAELRKFFGGFFGSVWNQTDWTLNPWRGAGDRGSSSTMGVPNWLLRAGLAGASASAPDDQSALFYSQVRALVDPDEAKALQLFRNALEGVK